MRQSGHSERGTASNENWIEESGYWQKDRGNKNPALPDAHWITHFIVSRFAASQKEVN
jgi:hypothetical protein